MNEYARSGLIMLSLVTVMCGAVIIATDPLRRQREELERLYSFNQLRRVP